MNKTFEMSMTTIYLAITSDHGLKSTLLKIVEVGSEYFSGKFIFPKIKILFFKSIISTQSWQAKKRSIKSLLVSVPFRSIRF